MGRNKIKIEKIDNERIRQVTYYKRKRGLIKKSMELSLLCEVKVMLCVMDKNDKMVIYCSDATTLPTMQTFMQSEGVQKEYLSNTDYKEMFFEATNQSISGSQRGSGKNTENSYTTDNEGSSFENEKIKPVEKKKSTFFSSNKYQTEVEKNLIKDLTPKTCDPIVQNQLNPFFESPEIAGKILEKLDEENITSLEKIPGQEESNVQIFIEKKQDQSTSSKLGDNQVVSETPLENFIASQLNKNDFPTREILNQKNENKNENSLQPDPKAVNKDFSLFLNTLSTKMNGNMTNQYQKNQLSSFHNFANPNGIIPGIKLDNLNGLGNPLMNNYQLGGVMGGVNSFNQNLGMMDIQQLQTLQMMQNIQSYQNLPQNFNNNMQANSLLQNIYNNSICNLGLNGQVMNTNINSIGNNLGSNFNTNFNPNANTMNNYSTNLGNISNFNPTTMSNFPGQNNFNSQTGFNPQKLNSSDNLANVNYNQSIYYNPNQNLNSIAPSNHIVNNMNQNNSKFLEALFSYQQNAGNTNLNILNPNNMNANNMNYNSSQLNPVNKADNDFLHKRFREESFSNMNPSSSKTLGIEPSLTNLRECDSGKQSLEDKADIKESCKEE